MSMASFVASIVLNVVEAGDRRKRPLAQERAAEKSNQYFGLARAQ
jgi:hypothetical protein